MDSIQKQARIARRRLTIQRFLAFLPWTLLVGLAVALVGVALPKLMHLSVDPVVWFASWIGGSVAIALLTNFSLTFIGRASLADAAFEIDRRFGLRERLSSALVLSPEDRETELGQALAEDANRKAETIDVRDQFAWGITRKLMLPILPALLMVGLWYLPNRAAPESVTTPESTSLTQVKNSTKSLIEQVKKKRKLAEDEGLNAAVDMFKQVEGELAKLQKDTKLDTKQTLAKLNDIKEQLAERRKELGSADTLRKNLKSLEKFSDGPAEKLADALKQGDFNKAEEALEKLMEKMQDGSMDPKDMDKLQQQLEQLQKAASDAAQQHEQAKQNLQEQIKQAEAAGDLQKAAQLQRKMEQMQGQDAAMAQLQEMSEMLSQAAEAMKQGDMQAAQEAMDQMASQLQQMNQSDAELQDLDDLMDSLSQSKSQMMCSSCNGMGCSQCMGSMQSDRPGQGMGEGQGQGERPEEEDETDFFDSRVRDKMKLGETVYGGKVGGANRKGVPQSEVQEAVLSALSEEPEPLDDTPLPKMQQDHTRDYFNTIRTGQQ